MRPWRLRFPDIYQNLVSVCSDNTPSQTFHKRVVRGGSVHSQMPSTG
jgi:hypothetical protein